MSIPSSRKLSATTMLGLLTALGSSPAGSAAVRRSIPPVEEQPARPAFYACFRLDEDPWHLSVSYRSREPKNDLARLGREADEVFGCLQSEAERRGVRRMSLSLTFLQPDSSELSTGFGYERQDDGSWTGTGRYAEFSELPDSGAAGGLSRTDLEKIRQAVSRVPEGLPLDGATAISVCVEASAELVPERFRVAYEDESAGPDEAGLPDSVAEALRAQADRFGVEEITILSGDFEVRRRQLLVRQGDGRWLESVVEIADPMPASPPPEPAPFLQACVFLPPGDTRPSLLVSYRSRLPRNGVSGFAPEAGRVFDVLRKESERRNLKSVFISPTDARGISSGMGFHRGEEGGWTRPFEKVPPEPPMAEGPPLTDRELEQIRRGVLSVPEEGSFSTVEEATYCAASDSGYSASYLSADLPDARLGKGDPRRLDAVSRVLQVHAERNGLREIRIGLRDGDRTSSVRQLRGTDGRWRPAGGDR